MIYHPEYKAIRLGVYAKNQGSKHYNVEMPVRREISIERRADYYHSQIDMEPCILALKEKMKQKNHRVLANF